MSNFESSQIQKKTQKAIFEKISALNRESLNDESTGNFFSANNTILESKHNPISQHIVRSCFARLSIDYAVEANDNENVKKTFLKAENISSFVSGDRFGKNKQANRPLTFNKSPFNDDENFIWRGETGITNIQVTQKSFFVNEIVVSYTCPDPIDFEERIKPKFLQLGNFAAIEFGWGIDAEAFATEAPELTMNSITKLQNGLKTFNERYSGNYQVFCGDITNYTFKVDENGYYSGTITIVSRGNNVLHSTINNEDTEDRPMADFKVIRSKEEAKRLYRDTNDLDKVYKNNDIIKDALNTNKITFKGTIEGLEDVVETYLSGNYHSTQLHGEKVFEVLGELAKLNVKVIGYDTVVGYGKTIGELFNEDGSPTEVFLNFTVEQHNDVINSIWEVIYRLEETFTRGETAPPRATWEKIELAKEIVEPFKRDWVFGNAVKGITAGKAEVDTKFYNGAMEYRALDQNDKEYDKRIYPSGINNEKLKSRFLVSWGWFEDHILNSFFQLKTNYKNINDASTKEKDLLSFRSVHTPLLYELSQTEREEFRKKYSQEKHLSPTTTLFSENNIKFSNRCNNSRSLKSIGLTSVILPGQTELKTLERYMNSDKDKFLDKGERENRLEAERLLRIFTQIDNKFKPFGKTYDGYGHIRNMVFDVKYLKSHFLNVTSVQDGIRSLFSDVNTKYGNFFNFMLKQDDEKTGNVGVTDSYYLNPIEKKEKLLSEKQTVDYKTYLEGNKELSSHKIFRFDLYSKNTIIRDFDLSLNLSDKAATMAYFNGLGDFVGGGYYNPNQHKDFSLERFAALTSAEVYNKEYTQADKGIKLKDNKRKNEQYILNNVTIPVYGDKDKIGLGTEFDEEMFNKKGAESNQLIDDIGINFANPSIKKNVNVVKNRLKKKRNEERKQNDMANRLKPTPAVAEGPYTEMGELDFRLQNIMKNNANHSPDPETDSNYKLQKTIIPIDLNMTIDGVGGLMPGNLFRVDYLPKLYREYCYFQVFTVGHQVNTSGWTTSITAKMKLDYPKLYKDKLYALEETIDEFKEKDVMDMTVDELRLATLDARVNPNGFERLDEDIQEGIKELNQASYGWSGEETEIRNKIASDNTIKSSFDRLIKKGANKQSIANSYVKRELTSYLPNQVMQINYQKDYNDFISKYSKIVIDAYEGKSITI